MYFLSAVNNAKFPVIFTPIFCFIHRYLQVDKQKEYHGTTELKLGGCPWWADGNDAVEARYFISSLIGSLKANGWEVCGTIDLSRHNNDKSTIFVQYWISRKVLYFCSFQDHLRISWVVLSSPFPSQIFPELSRATRPDICSLVPVPAIQEMASSLILSCLEK